MRDIIILNTLFIFNLLRYEMVNIFPKVFSKSWHELWFRTGTDVKFREIHVFNFVIGNFWMLPLRFSSQPFKYITTVTETFYFSTRTVSKRWANGGITLNVFTVNDVWTQSGILWMMCEQKRWGNTESKHIAKLECKENSESTGNTKWTIY